MKKTYGKGNLSPGTPPLFSIITAAFNVYDTIEKTINSLSAQSFSNFEYIVIDGGSTDGTREILERRSSEIDYWVSEADRGIYDAWNKGVAASCGRYIAFLGADDSLRCDALQAYADYLLEHPHVEFVSSKVSLGPSSDAAIIGEAWNWQTLRRRMLIAHPGSLHKRDLFIRHGLFDTNYKIIGDYEMLLRFGPELNAGFLDKVTVEMGVGGVSQRAAFDAFREAARAKRVHQAGPDVFIRLDLLWATIKRRIKIAFSDRASSWP